MPFDDREGFLEDFESLGEATGTFDSALIVHGIFSTVIILFGVYMCCRIMLPQNRFERNTNLAIFYMASFAFLFISCLPHNISGVTKNKHYHDSSGKKISVISVCTEIFLFGLMIIHLSSVNSVFLLQVAKKYKDYPKV